MSDEKRALRQLETLAEELRARLDAVDRRLLALESGAAAAPTGNGKAGDELDDRPAVPKRTLAVTISPLHDVSLVRVVEDALAGVEGIEGVALREVRGDAAQLEVEAREDVALISGLRRTLPLAFDIQGSDSSFTIALAQPRAEREGGVAAPGVS